MNHMHEAIGRLRGNPNFAQKYTNVDILGLLPLMIKESSLDNTSISKTGAMGYFQLKRDAITDAHSALKSLGITKTYNPSNPVENCILGIMYYLNSIGMMKSVEKDASKEFVLFSYNVGVAKTDALIELYKKEHKTGSAPSWEIFALWLSQKGGNKNQKLTTYSSEYNIRYTDYFGGQDWSKDATGIRVSQRYVITKSKIQEGINYVEKIRAIANTDQSRTAPKPTPVPSTIIPAQQKPVPNIPQPPKESPSRVLPYDPSRSEFHGDGPIDTALHWLGSTIGNHSKYGHIQAEKGDTIIKILKAAGITPNKENIQNFRNINRLDSEGKDEDPVKIGAYYLVPKVGGEATISTPSQPTSSEAVKPGVRQAPTPAKPTAGEKPTPQSEIEKERLSRDFYKWLDTIEVKNNSLKGKTFILDPGHGGGDPGAVPIAMRDGKPIPYRMSDITGAPGQEKIVTNGKGDGHLRVVEARVVMDVAYRIAKQLKENGATVKITHYFQKGIDDGPPMTESSRTDAPGLLDEIENYDTWSTDKREKFTQKSNRDKKTGEEGGLQIRTKIRNQMMQGLKADDVYFISLHADSGPVGKRLAPNILHEVGNDGQRTFAHLLAQSIGEIRKDKTTAGTREKGVLVLNKSAGAHNQNVLIELGNMADPNTAFALRSKDTRQEYADKIFRGLHTVATRLGPVKISEKGTPEIGRKS